MSEEYKKDMTIEEVHTKLVWAAQIENNPMLLQLRDIHANMLTQVQELEAQINSYVKPATDIRQQLKADIKAGVEAGREFKHALITVARRKKWEYDADAALEWAKEYDPKSVKQSLILSRFKKNLPTISPLLFPAEQVEVIDIKLPTDLSHLLISAEE